MEVNENCIKEKIIKIGKRLYDTGLVVARSGNISSRLQESIILITASGAPLGNLAYDDILKVDLRELSQIENRRLSKEFPLHQEIYKNFPAQAIIHAHPPLINGFFAVYSSLKPLTYEAKLFLGSVPVIEQDTPTITRLELVIEGLKTNNLVVIRNHGVVSIADSLTEALYLIETLEDAVRVSSIARLFKKDALDELDRALHEDLISREKYFKMFSQDHINAIVYLVNQDEFIAQKGEELNLTLQLAIKLEETNQVYKFTFERGKITSLEFDENAPFVISASQEIWELIFLGKLDPFVAVNQGKMKLKGDLLKLSTWYTPFSRLFELFKLVKIR